jgi:hypothetical protein
MQSIIVARANGLETRTTWWNLVYVIDEVTDNDAESSALLETMLAEGRISFCPASGASMGGSVVGPWA